MTARFDLFANPVGAKIAKRFGNTALAIQQSTLTKSTQELVSLRISQINGCGWCTDVHTKELAHTGEDSTRINLVAAWREAEVFTEAEQAALALAEEATRIGDGHHGVSDETWAKVTQHYDEDQTAALLYLVSMMNAANRIGVIMGQKGGSYQPGMFTTKQD